MIFLVILGLTMISALFLFFPIIYRVKKGASDLSRSLLFGFINTIIAGSIIFALYLYGLEGKPFPNAGSVAGFVFICIIIYVVSFLIFFKKKKDKSIVRKGLYKPQPNETVTQHDKKTCAACGKTLDKDSLFCPKCGTPVTTDCSTESTKTKG